MDERAACILDGASRGGLSSEAALARVDDALRERGWSPTVYRMRDLEVSPCRGCFACWVKTPGVCIIDDVAREIARTVARSALLVFVAPVTFGGYSSELKKAVDRLIPLILPYFTFVGREVHHIRRYPRYASLLGVGLLPRPDPKQEKVFRTLVRRNSINFHAPEAEVCFVYGDGTEGEPSFAEGLTEVIG
ncbi:flavodoxin family protein [Candidatus Bipolaricaulota bacterium]